MRKFLSFFFSITLAMAMLPAAAFAVPNDSDSQVADAQETSEAARVIEPQAGNIATGTWGTCPWEISEDGALTVHPGNGAESTDMNYSPWKAYSDSITKVVFVREGGKRVMAPVSCIALFARMPNIIEIDFSGFDTSKTVNMDEMFIMSSALQSVDFSNLDTSNVTTMQTMFGGCTSLMSVNLSGVNTSKLKWAGYMFSGCSSLESLDVSSFDTSSLVNMYCMFNGCSSLKSLDLSNFDTTNVTDVRNVLSGCTSLTKLKLGTKTTNLVVPGDEVDGKTDWYSFELHARVTADEINNSRLGIADTYIKGEPKVFQRGAWGTSPWELYEDGVFVAHPGNWKEAPSYAIDTYWGFGQGAPKLTKIIFSEEDGQKVIAPANSSKLFRGIRYLVEADLSGLDTSNVVSMSSMFSDCPSLKALDLSNFDTSNVTGMSSMFSGCSSLKSLDISSFQTSQVIYMSNMFSGCSSLSFIDLTNFQTSCATGMSSMFSGCLSLETLDISGFDTSSVTNMSSMFSGCSSLKLLDLANFQTFRVTNMDSMFSGCSSLETLDLSGFSTVALESYADMLKGCDSLKSISLGQNVTKFPMPGTEWLSKNENKWFTADEIMSLRLGIADTYTDLRTPLSEVDINYGPCSYVYTGKPIKPVLTLTNKSTGYKLVEGRDYTVSSLLDNVNVGTAAYYITGIGNYKGFDSDEAGINYFKITPAPITSVEVLTPKMIWDHAISPPSIVVKSGDYILVEGVDYTHNWYDINGGVGKRTLYVEAISRNYTGSKQYEVEVIAAPISAAYLDCETYYYDGTDKKPHVQCVDVKREGHTSSYTNDEAMEYYDVVYPEHSSQPGVYYVTVKGKGTCTGTVTARYEILSDSSSPITPDLPIDPAPDPGAPDNPDTPSLPAQTATQTMFRLYNPNSGEHFYTSSTVERDSIIAVGWQDEGTGWIAPSGGDPVYRLYNQYAGEHHYTTSVVERDMLVSVGWNDEGVGWYAGGERPLYRLYNPNAYANNHHYSTDVGERDILISIGWQDEGIAWYGVG